MGRSPKKRSPSTFVGFCVARASRNPSLATRIVRRVTLQPPDPAPAAAAAATTAYSNRRVTKPRSLDMNDFPSVTVYYCSHFLWKEVLNE